MRIVGPEPREPALREVERAVGLEDPRRRDRDLRLLVEDARQPLERVGVDARVGVQEEDVVGGARPPAGVACRQEHEFLFDYAKSGAVPIYGLNYKDNREDALAWLEEFGDPYLLSAVDLDGRVAIDYGVYGAPETYLIDKSGTIRLKHVGPVTPDVWAEKILPMVQQINREGTTR